MRAARILLESLEDRFTPADLLVTLAANADPAVLGSTGVQALGPGIYEVQTNDSTATLAALPGVESVENNRLIATDEIPNDPSFGNQYALDQLQAPAAWDVSAGTGHTIVAVIDSGVDLAHPDLAANIWTNPNPNQNGYVNDLHGWDFIDNDNNPQDVYGHGTHVAGILGAVGDNGIGVTGVDWHTQIMPLRFLGASGNGYTSDAIRAITYAIDHGAKILNMSWGGATRSTALTAAIQQAQAAGDIIVAAAGNSTENDNTSPNYPASYASSFDNVISVAATNSSDRLASFSNYGAASVTLAAPGDRILSTLPNGQYGTKTGTSMATPFVSGALALLWDQHPDWTYQQIIARLEATVDPLPSLTSMTVTGGRLNLARLLGGTVSPPTVPPNAPPPAPISPPSSPPPIGFVPVPVTPLPVVRKETIAVGAPQAGQTTISLLNADGTTRADLLIPDPAFAGGARVACGDFNGDGSDDIVLGTCPGATARVEILDGVTHQQLFNVVPFGNDFTGGIFVSCGDLMGDGVPDLVISPDQGGGPRIRVFNGAGFQASADFFAFDDPHFRGGCRTAIGDLNGDGIGDLAVAAGFGGGPRVAAFDGKSLAIEPRRLFNDFFAFESTLRNGCYIAIGALEGHGKGDLIASGGPGGGPRITAFSGQQLLEGQMVTVADFFAGDPTQRSGVRVAVKDLDDDGNADLVAGGAGRVYGFSGKNLIATSTPSTQFGFDVPIGFAGGVFVG